MNATDAIARELREAMEELVLDEVVREIVETGTRSIVGRWLEGLVF